MKRLHAVVLFVLGFAASGGVLRRRDRRRHHLDDLVDGRDDDRRDDDRRDNDDHDDHDDSTTTPAAARRCRPVCASQASGSAACVPAEAVAAVQTAFRRPLPVVVDRSKLLLDPTKVASAYSATAVARARIAAPGSSVQLVVAVRGPALRAWLAAASQRFARAPVDASLKLKNGKPFLTKDKPGRRLDTARLAARIVTALQANTRLTVRARTKPIPAKVSVDSFAETIVINRSTNRLSLYDTGKLRRIFEVATGQAIYPTPAGVWHIVVKWKNPTWYPPVQDAWARGLKPVPPGPEQPARHALDGARRAWGRHSRHR